MKRLFRMTLFLIIGLAAGFGIKYAMENRELNSGVIDISPDGHGAATILKQPESTDIAGASDLGGAFTLVNQDGNTVTDADYAHHHKLIFFGFTYCPAVCPTELQKMAVILDSLGEDVGKITPLFISVDPERDTAEVIKKYVRQFHPNIVGLTGSQKQIDAVTKAFKAYASKVENDMMEGYMIDHSSFMYFTDHNNTVIDVYPSTDTAEQIAKRIREKVR